MANCKKFLSLLLCGFILSLIQTNSAEALFGGKKKAAEPQDPNLSKLMMLGYEQNLRQFDIGRAELEKNLGHGPLEMHQAFGSIAATCGPQPASSLPSQEKRFAQLHESSKAILTQADSAPELDAEEVNFCSAGMEQLFEGREKIYQKIGVDLQRSGLAAEVEAFHRKMEAEKEHLARFKGQEKVLCQSQVGGPALFTCECASAHEAELAKILLKLEQYGRRLQQSAQQLRGRVQAVVRSSRSLAAYETGQKKGCGEVERRQPAGNCNGQRQFGIVNVGVCVNTTVSNKVVTKGKAP